MPRNTDLPTIPHSWRLDGWDQDARDVFPGSLPKAQQLVRYHRDTLVAAGALVRIGLKIVVLGGPYHAWLSRPTACRTSACRSTTRRTATSWSRRRDAVPNWQ